MLTLCFPYRGGNDSSRRATYTIVMGLEFLISGVHMTHIPGTGRPSGQLLSIRPFMQSKHPDPDGHVVAGLLEGRQCYRNSRKGACNGAGHPSPCGIGDEHTKMTDDWRARSNTARGDALNRLSIHTVRRRPARPNVTIIWKGVWWVPGWITTCLQ